MKTIDFNIPKSICTNLAIKYPNLGKNSDVGKFTVEIVKCYFTSIDPNSKFILNHEGVDIAVTSKGKTEEFEVKGTADRDISFHKLKVSSQECYDKLIGGMTLIRVTEVGKAKVKLHFMKHGLDFKLKPEPRWSVSKA